MTVIRSWDGYLWYENPRGATPRERNTLITVLDLINRDSIFVDVGAHIGFFAIRVANMCKWVHAIEPNPEAYTILEKNIELNNIGNITVHKCACGLRYRRATIYIADTETTLLPRTGRNTLTVDVKPLDSLVNHCDVVKIDVEGWERDVVLGASRIIDTCKPIWVIEHHDLGAGASLFPEIMGSYKEIRAILHDYTCIPFDEGRVVYIHKDKINSIRTEALKRLLTLCWSNKVIKNIEHDRPWYYGLPYTWWYGCSILDFIEQLPDHVLDEPEWLKRAEEII